MNPAGVAYALLAYGTWGVLPAYWKLLASVPAAEIVANRVVWTVLFTLVLLAGLRRFDEVRGALRDERERRALLAGGLLISLNWGIFIWAVNHDRLLEASFGYYLNPLLNVLIGVIVLREHLYRVQALAVGIAALGVAVLAFDLDGVPWIALSLAGSFALYGLVHKLGRVRALPALAVETGAVAPLALLGLVFVTPRFGALAGADLDTRLLLLGAGPVTALPLLWFASAARRLPLSTLGLFQYLAPSGGFALAVFVYGEPFGRAHAFAFACIWTALAVYTADGLRRHGAARAAARRRAAPSSPAR